MKKDKTIMLLLDAALKEKINEQAHEERLNMSEFIRRVIEDYIDNKKASVNEK